MVVVVATNSAKQSIGDASSKPNILRQFEELDVDKYIYQVDAHIVESDDTDLVWCTAWGLVLGCLVSSSASRRLDFVNRSRPFYFRECFSDTLTEEDRAKKTVDDVRELIDAAELGI